MDLITGHGGFEELMKLAATPHATQHDVNAGFGAFRTLVATAHDNGDIDTLARELLEIVRRTIRADPPEAAFAWRTDPDNPANKAAKIAQDAAANTD